MKIKIIASCSGIVWAAIVALVIKDKDFWGQISDIRWIACIAAPIVGLCIYYASRWTFRKGLAVRIVWSAVSLYFAAVLYAAVLGFVAFLIPMHGASKPASEIGVEAFVFIWGITCVPVLWLLFPLSFLNQQFLRSFEENA